MIKQRDEGEADAIAQGKDTLHPEVYEQRKQESKQLDSLGAWKDKMDTRGTAKLPLVEFRSLVRDDLQRAMTVPRPSRSGSASRRTSSSSWVDARRW